MWLLLVVVALAAGACDVARITACTHHVDLNGDALISAHEIDMFMLYQPCGPIRLTARGETLLRFGDRNHDGFLSGADLTPPPSYLTVPIKREICRVCDLCDASPPGESYVNMTMGM